MPPAQFQTIGGTLLRELGGTAREFNLATFAKNWRDISTDARNILFSPQQRRNIDEVANLGEHIAGALRDTNTSRTAHAVILWDILRDTTLLIAAGGSGYLTGQGVAESAAAAVPAIIFTRWLGAPAASNAVGNFIRAYRGLTFGQPTPARIAAFKIATRNFAHTVDVPVDHFMRIIADRLGGRAEPPVQQPQQQQPAPRPPISQ